MRVAIPIIVFTISLAIPTLRAAENQLASTHPDFAEEDQSNPSDSTEEDQSNPSNSQGSRPKEGCQSTYDKRMKHCFKKNNEEKIRVCLSEAKELLEKCRTKIKE